MISFLELKQINRLCMNEIIDEISDVVKSGWYILGDRVKTFEMQFSEFCGIKETVGSVLYEDLEKIIISTIDYDLELYKDYFCELMVACQNNDNSVVCEIVEFIKDVNETNKRGWTPLIVACYNGALDIVSLLISHGADINKSNMNGTTPLMYAKDYALKSGNLDIINILLSNGASSSMKDICGKTVIDYFDRNDNQELYSLLSN